jgi:Uma2 family endonuclease
MPENNLMTEEEFLEFCDEDTFAEYVDGEVIMNSPVSYKHNQIMSFLDTIIRMFISKKDLGIIFTEGFQIRIAPNRRRIPDLFFVSEENPVKITDTEINGAPDLVIEIVSPSSVARDWREKYLEYEAAGITEYWVIDPNSKHAEIYVLDENRKYQVQKVENGIVKSNVLDGFWLKPEWFWQEPLPNVLGIVKELGII